MTETLPPPLPSFPGNRGHRRLWLNLGLTYAGALIAVICLGLSFVRWLMTPKPTPEQLRERFHTHKAEFERLVAMMGEESAIVGVHSDWVELHDQSRELSDMGQDRHRLRKYRQLLDALHLKSIQRYHDGYSLTAWVGGALPDDGESLGFWYFSAGNGPSSEELVQNFTPHGQPPKAPFEYMPLEAPWFLVYSY